MASPATANEYRDQTRTCTDCGSDFVWTAGEQRFYAEKGFRHAPKRCPACRDKKRDRQR